MATRAGIGRRTFGAACLGTAGWLGLGRFAWAQQIDLTVSGYGSRLSGLPFAVARSKGWFKELAGLDVRGFIRSVGGGTTLRNAMASEIPYGEVTLPAAMAAIQQGLDLTLVHGGVHSLADQIWVVRSSDSALRGLQDLAGRRLGYSAPGSVSDMVTARMAEAAGPGAKIERKAVGMSRTGLAALREGVVDVYFLNEPAFSVDHEGLSRLCTSADVIGPCVQTVGVAKTDWLRQHGAVMRGIIAARRRGVSFIQRHVSEAAQILAPEYQLDEAPARAALGNVLAVRGFWSEGQFDIEAMETMRRGLQRVGLMPGLNADWIRAIDETWLPVDLRRPRRAGS